MDLITLILLLALATIAGTLAALLFLKHFPDEGDLGR